MTVQPLLQLLVLLNQIFHDVFEITDTLHHHGICGALLLIWWWSPVVHTGSDREHMDLDVSDVSPQHSTEQMDEGFTATAYSKVQENLKLTVEAHVLLEEPTSASGTLSSLQHLSK
nr:hypothetical protein [Tanacetum cinerariifolium]